MKNIFLVLCLLAVQQIFAQNTFIAIIKNEDTKKAIPGAAVQIKEAKRSAIADDAGIVVLSNLPNGTYEVRVTSIGYKETGKTFTFPLASTDTVQLFIEAAEDNLGEVTVVSTRANRSINNTPTRVEVISGEELQEEATMRPGDIRMLLAESTGIQVQATSAITANASIRIQGLDGRYTQILKDGFPIYSGAASGLGLLQTPPLDLRQVEVIKGASSTLYGGGAIAGLINLISKAPTDKRELNGQVNATSAGGFDVNGFYSQRYKKAGITLFASRNSNKAFDPAGISFTAIPKFERYTINPKLFLYCSNKTSLNFGINTTFENRLGGDINYIEGKGDSIHSYFEKDKTKRASTQLSFNHTINSKSSFTIKNSVGYFNRIINNNDYTFDGTQYSTFTEADYINKREKSDWVTGITMLTDEFKEKAATAATLRSYSQTTFGAFAQNTWNAADWLTLETGLRADYVKDYGVALLPRVSALFKMAPGLTSRIGGGFGYKAPTLFTEESERLLYKNVLPVSIDTNTLERSYGANGDVSFKTSFDELTFSINQFFFYTCLKHPLFLEPAFNDAYSFQNINGHIATKGAETNVKFGYEPFALYLGFTYTDAKVHNRGITYQNPLTPKYRFNADLVYELEDKWKIGSELYHFSKQQLSDGTTGKGYWLYGLLVEKEWEKFSVYINLEDIGDIRQTKFESIYTGTLTHPVFKDIYAPLEGFVVNGGIKFRL